MAKQLFGFPNPVNEVSARLVAAGVVVLGSAALVTPARWLVIPLAYGFVARVLTGPTLSPLGQFVTRIVTPRLRVAPKNVPGPPKRFAQGIGALFSVGALLAWIAGAQVLSSVLLAFLIVAAALEAIFAYCLGCKAFALLVRARIIPAAVCEECADISARLNTARTS